MLRREVWVGRLNRGMLTLVAASSVLLWSAGARADRVPSIAPDEVRPGQTGYGLSVFSGTEPERFEVEVIGVMHNRTAELSYIMAKLSGNDLETQGVAQGMSGSPVYLDGKLAGAVAFSFNFSQDAIAGITPIAGMRSLAGGASGPSANDEKGSVSTPVTLDMLAAGVPAGTTDERLREHLARLLPPSGASTGASGTNSAVHWHAGGFEGAALDLLRTSLGTISQTGGQMDPLATVKPLVAGSAVAMVLVGGDVSLAAHGTVTEVDGDEVLAFGHPIFGFGPMRAPMAHSEVLTTVASLATSFKISNLGPVIGAFDQDREAGARGYLGVHAPTFPFDVHLRGLETRDYHMDIADIPQLVPSLLATTALGTLRAGAFTASEMGIDLEARFRLGGYEDLVLRQSFDSAGAAAEAVTYLLTISDYLVANDFEAARIEGLEATLMLHPKQRTMTVVAAHASKTVVEPGSMVPVVLELQPHRGSRLRQVLEVPIPAHLENGRYWVLIGDGSSMDTARRTISPRSARSLSEALTVLRGYRSRRDLVTFGLVQGAGLSVGGNALPDLPGSMRSIVGSSTAATIKPLSLVLVDERVERSSAPLSGAVRIDLEVQRRP